jgi:hypothetical protein
MTTSAERIQHPAHELAGYVFEPWPSAVTRARQAAFHSAVGVASSVHNAHVDPSVLANDCLHGARPRDALGDKRLHVGARVRQIRPILPDTPLTVCARVESVSPVTRGRMIAIAFDFAEADSGLGGSDVAISILHESLILNPADPQATPR